MGGGMEVGGSVRLVLWRVGSRGHPAQFAARLGSCFGGSARAARGSGRVARHVDRYAIRVARVGSLDQIHNSSPTGRANSHPSHSPGEMQSAETRWGKIVNLILEAWPQRRPKQNLGSWKYLAIGLPDRHDRERNQKACSQREHRNIDHANAPESGDICR